MRKITKDSFEYRVFEQMRTPVYMTLFGETGMPLHISAIADLYKLYRFGTWHLGRRNFFMTVGVIDSVESFPDLAWLNENESSYLIYHKKHPKFGNHILEIANKHDQNHFTFFDYKVLKYVFDALDNNKHFPNVPTYYAEVYDRYDYQTNTHVWITGDPKLQDMYADLKTETD